ncbi:MAG: uncharacterized protein V7642_4230 [Burkholderiales bacterium]|jgi:uncharacterized protein
MKLLLWLALGLVIAAWLIRSNKALKSADSSRRQVDAEARRGDAEPMVQCAHCGIHIPLSESVAGPAGSVFCSEEHRRLHA